MGLNPDHVQTSIRLPKAVHDELKETIHKNGNSLNQEMLIRIMQYEDLIDKYPKAPVGESSLDQIKKELQELLKRHNASLWVDPGSNHVTVKIKGV